MKPTTLCRRAASPLALTLALTLAPSSCSSSSSESAEYVPSPMAYTAKVKNLLTGLAATDEEAQAVTADPAALRGLIDPWMETPEFRQKMVEFFKQAFQQTQINILQFEDQIGGQLPGLDESVKASLVRSAEMSFPLTALALIDEGRPFTEVVTTDRYVLNPPLMALLTYFDNVVIDDKAETTSWLITRFGDKFKFGLHFDDSAQVPFEASIDPNSPHFLQFYEPCPKKNGLPDCKKSQLVDRPERVNQSVLTYLLGMKFTAADWNDWRMIRIRPPKAGEDASIFWSLPTFRSKDPEKQELALEVPRVGFMTTPAFFANWPTNESNLARATINQTLIVGLGYSLADSNPVPVTETGKPDAQHATPGTVCATCHQTLDPMRNFFRQSFSVSYHKQTATLLPEQQIARFILDDVDADGFGVRDLAAIVAQHPRFAGAWTQKLCQFATSQTCLDTDPEFIRVSDAFRQSQFQFKALVRELFSSPLVTLAKPTTTSAKAAGDVSISRRDHFCAAMQNRLGLPDVCHLASTTPTTLQNVSFGIPGAGYARGVANPLLPREPNLFFASAVENLCRLLAEKVVDPAACSPGQRCFYAADAPRAIEDMVHVVMGISAVDMRSSDVHAILAEHYHDATQAGHAPSDALRSTFVLACASPSSSAIGF